MYELQIILRLLWLLIWTVATCGGGVGIYALVCSAFHPHPDAALFAIVALTSATVMTLALPDRYRQ
jgi:hypothetical protein